MASGPITSWQIDGETVETVADLIFWLKCLLGAEWFLSKMESFEILYSVALTWNVEKENIPKYILWPQVTSSLVKEIKFKHVL